MSTYSRAEMTRQGLIIPREVLMELLPEDVRSQSSRGALKVPRQLL